MNVITKQDLLNKHKILLVPLLNRLYFRGYFIGGKFIKMFVSPKSGLINFLNKLPNSREPNTKFKANSFSRVVIMYISSLI